MNKPGTALTVIIAVALAALFVEIIYLRRRRRRRRRNLDRCSDSDLSTDAISASSKEFLYFWCWKKKSRVEPQEASIPSSSCSPQELAEQVMKWQCLYGPSRVLFTIKEEEREGLESEVCSSAESALKTRRACFSEAVGVIGTVKPELNEVAVTIELNEVTPFSTPCSSPPYYTPSSSPTREIGCPTNSVSQDEVVD